MDGFLKSILFFTVILTTLVEGLSRAPQLECLNDALRLHFVPERFPFAGHVYVKGFFYSSRCHLDFTQFSMASPFYFHIPYQSDCQVRRERLQDPRGISYNVIVIVQHHRLFVTSIDKAYSVSCFYRDTQTNLEQQIQIGNLTTQVITQSDGTPTCAYDVLQGSMNGPIAKYANIGDVLVHKFTCDSADMGILVHSCYVRDGIGNEFALLNDRGCATDTTIVTPLRYSDDLQTAFAPIAAFKFADQMIVYFTCQVTLCSKRNNGCEGITPPVCQYIPLPNEDGGDDINVVDTETTLEASSSDYYSSESPIPPTFIPVTPTPATTAGSDIYQGQTTQEIFTSPPPSQASSIFTPSPPISTTTARRTTTSTLGPNSNYGGSHMPGSIPPEDYSQNTDAGYGGGRYAPGGNNSPYGTATTTTRRSSNTGGGIFGPSPFTTSTPPNSLPPLVQPSPQPLGPIGNNNNNGFFGGIPAARHARKIFAAATNNNDTERITLGVTAEQLIIFTKDEKADAKEMTNNNNNNQNFAGEEASSQICNQQKHQNILLVAICGGCILAAIVLLMIQRYFYQKRLQKFGNFSPPFELIGIKQ